MISATSNWFETNSAASPGTVDGDVPAPATKPSRSDDLSFAKRILQGWPAEVNRFITEFRPEVLKYLFKLSWDARSREEAATAVDDVFAECFGGFAGNDRNGKKRVPLLKRYKGHGSLEGWLKRSARNRFYSALRRSEYRQRAAGVEPEADWVDAASSASKRSAISADPALNGQFSEFSVTSDEQARIRSAIAEAFESLAATDSQALIFLRLHFLERVKKQRIAEAWQQHPATVGRRIVAGLDHLRAEIAKRLPDYIDSSSAAATESLILLCRDLLDSCAD